MKALELGAPRDLNQFRITNADDLIERGKQIDRGIQKSPVIHKRTLLKSSIAKPSNSSLNTHTPLNLTHKRLTPVKTFPNSDITTPIKNQRTPDINMHSIPSNLETGSLIVLSVNDPKSPGKKMLQTYIAQEPGKLTQVALPSGLLNSVVGYMKKGTPKSTVSNSSSPLISPNTNDSRTNTTGVQSDRKRQTSLSIMEL